jgi:DNA-binding transcriptional LysR family regulator
VSQHVAALEADLDTVLLHRRPVRPTAAGTRLAEHAARIVLRVDVARTELTHGSVEPVHVRVAASPLAAPTRLAAALRAMRAAAPATAVTVEAVGPDDAVHLLAGGRVDLAVVDGVVAPDSPLALVEAGMFTATMLDQEPLAVAVAADHPLARRGAIDLDTVVDAPWIDAPMLTGTPPGPSVSVRYDGADTATLLAMVAAGLGLALVPRSLCAERAGVTGIPCSAPLLVHRTELLTLRSPSPAAARLADALRARAAR